MRNYEHKITYIGVRTSAKVQCVIHCIGSKCSICPRTDKLYFITQLCFCLRTKRNSVVSLFWGRAQLEILLRGAQLPVAVPPSLL